MAIQDREENLTLSQDHQEMCFKVETSWAPSLKLAQIKGFAITTAQSQSAMWASQHSARWRLSSPFLLHHWCASGHVGILDSSLNAAGWCEERKLARGQEGLPFSAMLSCVEILCKCCPVLAQAGFCLHFVGKWRWCVGQKWKACCSWSWVCSMTRPWSGSARF